MLLESLPHKCKVLARRYTKGPTGGTKVNDRTLASDLECWEQSVSSNEELAFQKSGLTNVRKIYFNEKPPISKQNKVIITERNGVAIAEDDRIELHVIGRPQPDVSAGKGILYRVMCQYQTQEDNQ